VLEATEGELTRSGQEMSTINKIFKMVLGIGVERQTPLNSISFVISNFTKRISATHRDFIRDATNTNQLILDPFMLPKKFNELQKNRYREYSRLYDFVQFLRDDLKLSTAEIYRHVKDRSGFSKDTLLLIYQGKFNPANVPPIDFSSIYPGVLRRINNTTLYENNPLELKDIYNVQELRQIKKKWLKVPLQLSDAELEEYFITGKDPRLEDKEEIKIDKTSMVLPQETKTQLTELITPPNSVPIDTPSVSEEVVKTAALPSNINPKTGLTYIDDALLSTEEKAMRLRQKGMTA